MKKDKKDISREEYAKICPKCGSINISQEKSTLQQIGALPTRYICNDCGYIGFGISEIKVSDIRKIDELSKKDIKKPTPKKEEKQIKPELIDTSYGKVIVRVVWKYLSILIILTGLIELILLKEKSFWPIIINILIIIIGLVMFYITYFRLRKIIKNVKSQA